MLWHPSSVMLAQQGLDLFQLKPQAEPYSTTYCYPSIFKSGLLVSKVGYFMELVILLTVPNLIISSL